MAGPSSPQTDAVNESRDDKRVQYEVEKRNWLGKRHTWINLKPE